MKESVKILLEIRLRANKDRCKAIEILRKSADMLDLELTDVSEEKLVEMGRYLRLKEQYEDILFPPLQPLKTKN